MSFLLFLRRLIRVLRADTAPHQIGLGLALGILAGLPPFSLASVGFILLFLVLNANLGAFVSAMAVGGLLRFLLTSQLVTFGRAVLDAESLRGLWTWLLNLPVVSLSGFDLYLRFGATLAAVVLAPILFVLALVFVTPLRTRISRRVEGSPRLQRITAIKPLAFVGRLLFGKRKTRLDEIEGGGWIRKGFLIPFAIGIVGAFVAWQVFGPFVTKKGLETMASLTTGKDFTIGGAKLSFLGGSLGVADVDVLEPDVSVDPQIADGQRLRFDLSPGSLLSKRLVVDELAIENLQIFGAKNRPPGDGGTKAPEPPPLPPEPKEGEPIGLDDVYEWVEANEERLSWVLDRVSELLEPKPPAPPDDPKDAFAKQRATWVAQSDDRPFFVAQTLAVRNLVFDWRDERGPHTALERLDLSLDGLSSSPAAHDAPIRFGAKGDWAGHTIRLEGILDARKDSDADDTIKIALAAPQFEAARRLGIRDGEGLDLEIDLALDAITRSLSSASCKGAFRSATLGDVTFALDGVGARAFDVQLSNINLAAASAYAKPGALRVDQGTLGLRVRLGERQGALDGALELVANNLRLAPGSKSQIAGVRTELLCEGLNAATASAPLALRFGVGGTVRAPTLSMDEAGLMAVLESAKSGLLAAGRERLASEIEQRIGPLRSVVEKKAGRVEKILEDPTKVLGDPADILEDPGKILDDPKSILNDPKVDLEKAEKAGKRLGNQLEKSLGGLLGKDDDDDKKKKDKKDGDKKKKDKNKKKDGGS